MRDVPADQALALVRELADALRAKGLKLVTAESCTGGLIAAACTALAGSSDWFERGFVTYSNEAKVQLLGVDEALVTAHGAVSALGVVTLIGVVAVTSEPLKSLVAPPTTSTTACGSKRLAAARRSSGR